jgi:hypothetical protein
LHHHAQNAGVRIPAGITMQPLMQGGARRGDGRNSDKRNQHRSQTQMAKTLPFDLKPQHNPANLTRPILETSSIRQKSAGAIVKWNQLHQAWQQACVPTGLQRSNAEAQKPVTWIRCCV